MTAPTGPSWYDVLGVDPAAPTEDIRAAWRAASADLDPGTPRFRSLAAAAEVLLDDERRATYDASLAEPPAPALTDREERQDAEQIPQWWGVGPGTPDASATDGAEARAPEAVPAWLLGTLALAVVLALGATTWAYLRWSAGDVEESARAARSAAERAVVPVLSYDAADLDADQAEAQRYLTGDYRADYDQLFALIRENAPGTGTRVEVDVVASAVVRAEADRVQVLVFLDRPTTNKETTEPVVYRDQATLTMVDVDGEWLVDGIVTSPVED